MPMPFNSNVPNYSPKPPFRKPETHKDIEALRARVEQYEMEQLPPADPGHPYRKPSTQAMIEKLRRNMEKGVTPPAFLPASANIKAELTSVLDIQADSDMWLLQGGDAILEKSDYSGLPRIYIESAIPEEKNAANIKYIRDNYPMFADRMLKTNSTPDVPGYFQMLLDNFTRMDTQQYNLLAGLGDSFQVNLAPGSNPIPMDVSGILLFTNMDPWVLYWEELFTNLISMKACARYKTIISFKLGYILYKGYFTAFNLSVAAHTQSVANFRAEFLCVSSELQQPYKDLLNTQQDEYVNALAANKKDILKMPTSVGAGTATLQSTVSVDSLTIYSEADIDNVMALDASWQETVQGVISESEKELAIIQNNIQVLTASKAALNSADISDKIKLDELDTTIQYYEKLATMKENNLNMLKAKFAQGKASAGSVTQAAVSGQLSGAFKASKQAAIIEESVTAGVGRVERVVESFGAVSPSHTAVIELEQRVKVSADFHDAEVVNQAVLIRTQLASLPEPFSSDQQALQKVMLNNVGIMEAKIKSKTDTLDLLKDEFVKARKAGTFGTTSLHNVKALSTSLMSTNTEIQNSITNVEASVKDYGNSVAASAGGKVSPLLKSWKDLKAKGVI